MADKQATGNFALEMIDEILQQKRYTGVYLHPDYPFIEVAGEWELKLKEIEKLEPPINGVLVVMTNYQESEIYGTVHGWKNESNFKHIVVQCIKEENANHRNTGRVHACLYRCVNNILVKAGWTPWKIEWKNPSIYGKLRLNEPTMIMGMDVCHDRSAKESVVGFASTYDKEFVKLHQLIGIQRMGKELVHNIDKYFINAVETFQAHNDGQYPKQIFFYRDGVSSSQLEQVQNEEIKKLHDVIEKRKMETQIEVIVVQKGLKTRFYSATGQSLPPGTVVDEKIVDSNLKDFFLLASKAPPGKNPIPSRFIVLTDPLNLTTSDIGIKQLQTFSFHLCHLYFDCIQNPSRIPHVVKTADHVAFKFSDRNLKQQIKQTRSIDESIYDVDHIKSLMPSGPRRVEREYFSEEEEE